MNPNIHLGPARVANAHLLVIAKMAVAAVASARGVMVNMLAWRIHGSRQLPDGAPSAPWCAVMVRTVWSACGLVSMQAL